MLSPIRLIRSPVSVAGMGLTTISAVVFLVVFFADLFGMHTNPYIGIVFFLILRAIFVIRKTSTKPWRRPSGSTAAMSFPACT